MPKQTLAFLLWSVNESSVPITVLREGEGGHSEPDRLERYFRERWMSCRDGRSEETGQQWRSPAGDRSGSLTCVGLVCQAPLELGKTLDRLLFVGVHLKDFVQLSHLNHAIYVFRRIQKL